MSNLDEILAEAQKRLEERDALIRQLGEALEIMWEVAPSDPPASGLVKGAEEKHNRAIIDAINARSAYRRWEEQSDDR